MTETRYARATFTTMLGAICKRLEATPGQTLRWQHPLTDADCESQFTVRSPWVAGSYARGASDCGDLDLVTELVMLNGPLPPAYEVNKGLLKSPRGVQLHLGTPTTNTSNVAFSEAIRIWHGRGCDWRSALAGITPDPTVGHYARPTDRLPLRPEQLACDIEQLDALLALEEQQHIRWRFAPIAAPVPLDALSSHELEFSEVLNSNCGAKTRCLLQDLLLHFRQAGGWTQPYLRAHSNNSFTVGGAKVLVGRPAILVHEFDTLATSALLIVPHRCARGPNGIWTIERSVQHPLVLAAAQLSIYGLFEEDGQPDFYIYGPSITARGVDLFNTLERSRAFATEIHDEDNPMLKATALSPAELLSCLSRVDVAAINCRDFAITKRGQIALGCASVATTPELLRALAG